MRVRWLKQALANPAQEADTIAEDDPCAAAKQVLRIASAVALLADHPELVRAGSAPGTRELVVPGTPYLVPYRVRDQHIDVLRAFHGRRKWPERF